MRPAALVAGAFVIAIAVGTVLLALPVAHAPGHDVGWSDALFTATSAVCVTGLIVVDTGSAFSVFGRTVIALLIQAGGLGILTLGGLAALLVGRRVGYRQRLHLQRQVGALHLGGVMRLVRGIVLVVFAAEALLTLALWPRLAAEHGALGGLGVAAFHAVSAFNNAGFSTYSDSLARYVGDAWIDYSEGYVGDIQYAVVLHTSGANRCIEADNTGAGRADNTTPTTLLRISNLTCVTSNVTENEGTNPSSKGDAEGVLFREGAFFEMYNSIITSNEATMTSHECFELEDTEGPETIDAAVAQNTIWKNQSEAVE